MSSHYLKEVIANIDNNASLVIINQKKYSESVDFLIERLLKETNDSIILISLTRTAEEINSKENSEKLLIIDGFSEVKKEHEKNIYIGNECNLTKIQIGVEQAYSKLKGKIIIVFDSLNMLSLYNENLEISKFIYLFSNKTKLENQAVIFLTEKNSCADNNCDKIKSFCDKTYDFSSLNIVSIEKEN